MAKYKAILIIMESLLHFTLFGSAIAFWIMILIVISISIGADIHEEGFVALVAIIVALILNYFFGSFKIQNYRPDFRFISIYILLGFIFSVVRTYFKGRELSDEAKKRFELKDHVFRWWSMFPICALTWIFGSLLSDLFNIVYRKLKTFYEKIFNFHN